MTSSSMNISKNLMTGKCDEKCSYSFNYKTSPNCNATNYGNYIYLTYDKRTISPVKFNNLSYDVDSIQIYSPSVHQFNDNNVDGEIIITHSSLSSGSPLLVCVPINSATPVTEGSNLLNEIVSAVITKPLYKGDSQISVKLENYNLNSIVPKKPFYYYTSTNSETNVIVYGIENSIGLDKELINTLRTLITNPENVVNLIGDSLFYNKKGPSSSLNGTDDDQIYIDCKPTGNSSDTVDVEKSKSPINYDLNNLKSNKFVWYIIYSLLFVFVIFIINKLLIYLIN